MPVHDGGERCSHGCDKEHVDLDMRQIIGSSCRDMLNPIGMVVLQIGRSLQDVASD